MDNEPVGGPAVAGLVGAPSLLPPKDDRLMWPRPYALSKSAIVSVC